jgi:hypothetical protein
MGPRTILNAAAFAVSATPIVQREVGYRTDRAVPSAAEVV